MAPYVLVRTHHDLYGNNQIILKILVVDDNSDYLASIGDSTFQRLLALDFDCLAGSCSLLGNIDNAE